MTEPALLRAAIHDLLARFFQSFDDKDWTAMRACLCDEVFTDYSSFRDEPASTLAADRYVEQRRTALQALDMQHNFSNLRVEPGTAADSATARCNFIIHRFGPELPGASGEHFHSYGHYLFAFARVGGTWKISRIVQRLLRSLGNREIHGGTRRQDER